MANRINEIILWLVLIISMLAIIEYNQSIKECQKETITLNIVLDEGIWDIPKTEYKKLIEEQQIGKTTLIYQKELEHKWQKDWVMQEES